MKLLFDANLSSKLTFRLADLFPCSDHVRPLSLSTDPAIWDHASRHGFTIVTLDRDFAELVSQRSWPPKVIWLRCGNQATAFVATLLRRNQAEIMAFVNDRERGCLTIFA